MNEKHHEREGRERKIKLGVVDFIFYISLVILGIQFALSPLIEQYMGG